MLDIVIKNGSVVDGSGQPRRAADLAVDGGKIVCVGDCPPANRIIDVAGMIVAPGFIDMHSHADFTLPLCPEASSLVHQGVTTVVTGQCGMSPAPLFEGSRKEVSEYLGAALEQLPWSEWDSFGGFLDFLSRRGIAVNVAALVGHGTVRMGVMGFGAESPDPEVLYVMGKEISRAVTAGAFGLSTGLIYPPGSYAGTDELTALAGKAAGGIYFSHVRGEADTLLKAVSEAVAVGERAGVGVQISHFKAAGKANWGNASEALRLIDAARGRGVDVRADMYPYLAGSTFLHAMLPEWAQIGGREAILSRLGDADVRARMERSMRTEGFFRFAEWEQVRITSSPVLPSCCGRSVAELAAEAGKSPHDWVFDALLESELEMQMIIFITSEDNVRLQLGHPMMMFGTDGYGLAPDNRLGHVTPHPRSYGTFPRILSRYVREEGLLSLEEAVRKMSGLPAETLRLPGRGLLKAGLRADIVVFDPETVRDEATYEEPHRFASGISYVLVNGRVVVDEGGQTAERPGEILRPGE